MFIAESITAWRGKRYWAPKVKSTGLTYKDLAFRSRPSMWDELERASKIRGDRWVKDWESVQCPA